MRVFAIFIELRRKNCLKKIEESKKEIVPPKKVKVIKRTATSQILSEENTKPIDKLLEDESDSISYYQSEI